MNKQEIEKKILEEYRNERLDVLAKSIKKRYFKILDERRVHAVNEKFERDQIASDVAEYENILNATKLEEMLPESVKQMLPYSIE